MDTLRPFLVCRVLGVINLAALNGTDAVLCLAMLAQLSRPNLTMDDLIAGITVTGPRQPDSTVTFLEPPAESISTRPVVAPHDRPVRQKRRAG
jgi:hypothetical protein